MALITFKIEEMNAAILSRVEDGLAAIGAQGVSWAADRWRQNWYSPNTPERERTGNLVNSIAYATSRERSTPKTGGALSPAERLRVKIGSIVKYAARVEFGFTGKDSLGRYYNQPAKSYLRAGIFAARGKILFIMNKAIRG
jgi:hypothetical protein